jgi:DNA-binding IclR family transcriptional regulator
MSEGNVTYLGVSETSLPVRVASRVGKDVPAYTTAVGKIHLAYASDEELTRIYPENKLKRYTPNTIATIAELKKHLKDVATQEYAIDSEEFEIGVKCVAVPIKDYLAMSPVAAISISAPISRMSEERIQNEILPVLQKYAREISKRLGYQAN